MIGEISNSYDSFNPYSNVNSYASAYDAAGSAVYNEEAAPERPIIRNPGESTEKQSG